jgi:putative transposase
MNNSDGSRWSWSGSKKKLPSEPDAQRALIEPGHPMLSIREQCRLVGLNRATYYYQPAGESDLNLELMRLLDRQYTETPFYGWPRWTVWLRQQGYAVNAKRVRRLLRVMGLQAIYPKRRTTVPDSERHVYPYLLRDVPITHPNQVWSTDITYIALRRGYMYLVAIIDWYSRYVLAWELSNTMDGLFCLTALETALASSQPEIFNTDQGVQFTAKVFTGRLEQAGIRISMDGRGRCLDNIFVERLWRTIKYELIYLHDYETVSDLVTDLEQYFRFYNQQRPHQSLDYQTPAEVYRGLTTPSLRP